MSLVSTWVATKPFLSRNGFGEGPEVPHRRCSVR